MVNAAGVEPLAHNFPVGPPEVEMKIPLSKSEVQWYAECYKGLPPTERTRFVTAAEADEFLGRRLRAAACRGHLTVLDLEETARWKFPGPFVLKLIKANIPEEGSRLTQASFAAKDDEALRAENLLKIGGVGWPMASTILHFAFPDRYPVVDKRVMKVVGGPAVFGHKHWDPYIALCQSAATKYNVTLRELDRALWTFDYLRDTLGGPSPMHRVMQITAGLADAEAEHERGHKLLNEEEGTLARAQGCLLGQLVGDSLGSLVEFQTPEAIRSKYPEGVHDLADGGPFDLIAGQPTDDSEMALALARMLAVRGAYSQAQACKRYVDWLNSKPFDCGNAIHCGLTGKPDPASQANGALMRVSPLGIFGARYERERVTSWAEQDASITHPHPVCLQANALFASAIAFAIRTGCAPEPLYSEMLTWARAIPAEPTLLETIEGAREAPPADFMTHQGWVLVAMGNALWQLLNAPTPEEGIINTVMRGGDTDTNAAICGALLGAVHGRHAIPDRWIDTVLGCRPEDGTPGISPPRPPCYRPIDALELAQRLIGPR